MAVGVCKNTDAGAKLRTVMTPRCLLATVTTGVQFASVDPFAAIMFGGIAVVVLVVWLLGRYYPGSGLEQIGLRSAREIIETREELEAEDLDQMLRAHNARRRARGEDEVTSEDMELRIAAEQRDQERRREAYLADRELDQLLEATNQRRRARGLPARTREQVREEFGAGPTDD
jgi:hypothetical protein